MARTYPSLDQKLTDWIAAQHVYFVASAPNGPDGHVNVSPKGYDSFRVLDPRTVAYLDLTGSGVETIAHIRENGRVTVMFCAFEGPPRVLRLYGSGEVIRPGDTGSDELLSRFPDHHGVRAVIRVHLERISTSCGYGVPFMEFEQERKTLRDWTDRKGPEGIRKYHAEENSYSVDGLPGLAGLGVEDA